MFLSAAPAGVAASACGFWDIARVIDLLLNLIQTPGENTLVIALLIVLATFVLEDAATIGASLLAVTGVISPSLALGALYCGIVLGDLGLYGIGFAAKMTGWSKIFVRTRNLVEGRRWLRKRFIPALIGARFTPGMRMPTFLASGFLRMSFIKFAATILVVAAVWTGGLFTLIYIFGEVAGRFVGDRIWMVGVVLLAVAVIGPLIMARRRRTDPA